MFSNRPSKELTRPINGYSIISYPENIFKAQLKIQAKLKMAMLLRLKNTFPERIKVGDMIGLHGKAIMRKLGV